ncbi:MAG: lipocalin-like domain-containing protein, partial [Armatimonadetes bacterium]|nr:lipocalin-like domain-containing protein [Armatimonadota bacterium]
MAEQENLVEGERASSWIGVWKLTSFCARDSGGQTVYPFGRDPQGRLIYEPNARMAVQIMHPHRPHFPSGDPLLSSEAEVRAAFGG